MLYRTSIQKVLSLLREHPVLEFETFCVVMPEREFTEKMPDHVRFFIGFFFVILLLLALILDTEDDLEELVKFDLHRSIVIVLLHKLHDFLPGVDEAETD